MGLFFGNVQLAGGSSIIIAQGRFVRVQGIKNEAYKLQINATQRLYCC